MAKTEVYFGPEHRPGAVKGQQALTKLGSFDDIIINAHSEICRHMASSIYRGILGRSPVLSGTFKSNWNVSTGAPDYSFQYVRRADSERGSPATLLAPRGFGGVGPPSFRLGVNPVNRRAFGRIGTIAGFGGDTIGEADPAFFKRRPFPHYHITNGAWYGGKIEVTGWKSGRPPYKPVALSVLDYMNSVHTLYIPTEFGIAQYRAGATTGSSYAGGSAYSVPWS